MPASGPVNAFSGSSWPGLSRPSTSFCFGWMPGTRPGMTVWYFRLGRPPHFVRAELRHDLIRGRGVDAVFVAERGDLTVEPVELEPVAALEVVRHRGLHRRIDLGGEERHALLDVACRHLDAGGLAHGARLFHQCTIKIPAL